MKTVLFYRDSRRFRGHDLKVWHYFNHVLSSPHHTAYVRVFGDDVLDEENPWSRAGDRMIRDGGEVEPDVLFLSGVDWQHLDASQREHSAVPVINLIQHVKHACPDDPLGRYAFLSHKAIRICVSPSVEEALRASGRTHGPLFTIPNSVDLGGTASMGPSGKDIDLLIAANKAPELGRALAARLERSGRVVCLVDRWMERREFLSLVSRSVAGIFLPLEKEGFFLPPLEAMALETAVICPDCIGNRAYCRPGVNCVWPAYADEELARAAESVLGDADARRDMVAHGTLTAQQHDMRHERDAFLSILSRTEDLWNHEQH
jgi:hypothetical protein